MEKIKNEDGFNVVITQCDSCGKEIANLDEANTDWLTVEIKSLSRDEWSLEEDAVIKHFCTKDCFRNVMNDIDPHDEIVDENRSLSESET